VAYNKRIIFNVPDVLWGILDSTDWHNIDAVIWQGSARNMTPTHRLHSLHSTWRLLGEICELAAWGVLELALLGLLVVAIARVG
jgi:hypothetical protein